MLGFDAATLDVERPGRRVLAVVVSETLEAVVITSPAHDDVSYNAAIPEARRILASSEGSRRETVGPPRNRNTPSPIEADAPLLLPSGAAPRLRPWYRTKWGFAALVLVLPSVLRGTLSVSRPAPTPHTVIDTDTNVQDFALDAAADLTFAVLHDGRVLRIDPTASSAEVVADIDVTVADVAIDGGWLVASSALADEVIGVNVVTGAHWRTPLADAPRGVVLVDGVAIVALAGSGKLAKLDLTSGAELGRTALGRAPWDVAVVDGALVVSLAGSDELAVLDVGSLVERRRVPVAAGPRDLVVTGSEVWVYSAAQGSITVLDVSLEHGEVVATTPVFVPVTTLTGSAAFAFHSDDEPVDQVVVLQGRSAKPCTITGIDQPVALAVDGAGRLFLAYGAYNDLVVFDTCRKT
ncbi:MAG TPA: hypothetical protein VK988_02225 [Acidimicrobiales bacterium]|nr:hypothetical protein [Acidimicrobiales bacterium]